MAISQKQIMDRAYRVAVGVGGDPHDSPVADNLFVFEDLFPFAFREAVKALIIEGNTGGYKRTYTLSITDGRVTLPDTLLEEMLDDSQIVGENGNITSYQPNLQSFYFPSNTQLGHYAVDGNEFVYREPDGEADDFTGEISLKTAGVPDIPGSVLTDLGIPPELAERTIVFLAEMALGKMSSEGGGNQ